MIGPPCRIFCCLHMKPFLLICTQRHQQYTQSVSVLILHPREIQTMWSQTERQRKPESSQTKQGKASEVPTFRARKYNETSQTRTYNRTRQTRNQELKGGLRQTARPKGNPKQLNARINPKCIPRYGTHRKAHSSPNTCSKHNHRRWSRYAEKIRKKTPPTVSAITKVLELLKQVRAWYL